MGTDTVKLLRYAGFLTWGLTGLPLLVELVEQPALCREKPYVLWLLCFGMFGAAFGLTAWREPAGRSGWRQVGSLVLQSATALMMILLVCSGQEGALLVIVAAQVGSVLPLSRALMWVAVQATMMCAILAFSWSGTVTLKLMATYLGFQALALVSCFLTAREATARAALVRANRELEATRELLANTSRLAERERISRELHDTLGHHLTALSLDLEAATYMATDNTLTQVQRAQAVTRMLLADVRGAVSALRGDDSIGLAQALKAIVEAVPQPTVHLRVADDLAIADPMRTQTILRCVQEIVTNAIHHAHATNLWIDLGSCDSQIRLVVERPLGHARFRNTVLSAGGVVSALVKEVNCRVNGALACCPLCHRCAPSLTPEPPFSAHASTRKHYASAIRDSLG
jgi:signal transduction histidine kinase